MAKKVSLNMHVREEEMRFLRREAERLGVSLAMYVRLLVLAQMGGLRKVRRRNVYTLAGRRR